MKRFILLLLVAFMAASAFSGTRFSSKQYLRYLSGKNAEIDTPYISIEKARLTGDGKVLVRYTFKLVDTYFGSSFFTKALIIEFGPSTLSRYSYWSDTFSNSIVDVTSLIGMKALNQNQITKKTFNSLPILSYWELYGCDGYDGNEPKNLSFENRFLGLVFDITDSKIDQEFSIEFTFDINEYYKLCKAFGEVAIKADNKLITNELSRLSKKFPIQIKFADRLICEAYENAAGSNAYYLMWNRKSANWLKSSESFYNLLFAD